MAVSESVAHAVVTSRTGRQDRMDAAHQVLADAVGKLATSADWLAVLDISRRLRSYSPGNCLLLASQGAEGMVMGYQAWRRIPSVDGGHCQVRRGARSLKILAPVTRTVREEDPSRDERKVRRVVGFRVASVFDQRALVAPPEVPDPAVTAPRLLDGEPPDRVWDALVAEVAASGYRLVTGEQAAVIAPANGLTDHATRTVSVRSDLPANQQLKTLAHELAHVRLHAPDRRADNLTRAVAEIEAESVAYLITSEFGLDSSGYTVPYVTAWSGGDVDLVIATAHRAVAAARDLTELVGRHLDRDIAKDSPAVAQLADDPEDIADPVEAYQAGGGLPDGTVFAGSPGREPAVKIRYPGGATAQLPHLGGRSASGFGWGYVGDGPADLAYSLLAAVAGERVAEAHWSAITETIVATLPPDSAWELPISVIQGWVERHQAALAGSDPDGEGDAGADRIRIGTQTGWWELGWDPSLASFQAQHHRGAPVADASREPSAELGAAPAEVPTVGILEERLGFALPASVREALGGAQRTRPGAEVRAYGFVPTSELGVTGDASRAAEPAVELGMRPAPESGVQPSDTAPTTYAQAMLATSPIRAWEAGAGDGTSSGPIRVEIVAAEPYTDPDTSTARQAITYRLSQDARVVFSGDDITAPADVDPRGDDAVRAVVDLLCHPSDGQRLTEPQRAFLDANADLLTGLVSPPDPPYPPGTRVTVRADRQAAPTTGVVLEAVDGPDGQVSAYVWRPDAAELPGHPWRGHPDHGLVLPADQVTPTLAPLDTGVRDWTPSIPLAYGAVVEITGDGGHPVTATVRRALRDGPDGSLAYDLQPDAAGAAPLRVAAAELTPLTGTAWASIEQLLAQRARDGVPVEAGEVLATATGTHLMDRDGSSAVPAAPRPDAAETARPAPATVTIARHGEQVSVGDPHHGWMTVPADRLAAAMTRTRQEVAALIGAHAPDVRLTGAEAAITLAALAAHHAPTHLPAPPASIPSGPDPHLVNDL